MGLIETMTLLFRPVKGTFLTRLLHALCCAQQNGARCLPDSRNLVPPVRVKLMGSAYKGQAGNRQITEVAEMTNLQNGGLVLEGALVWHKEGVRKCDDDGPVSQRDK